MMHGGCDRESVLRVPKVQVSVQIDASPEEVWEAIEDVATHVDWMREAVAIRFTSSQRHGVGTTFDCDTKVGPIRLTDRMTITEWRPGKAMGVAHTGLVSGSGTFRLRRARRGRTRLSWQERLDFPWWWGGPPGAFVSARVLKSVWRRNLADLKAIVERGG